MSLISPGAIIGRALQIYREQVGTLLAAALIVYAVNLLATLLLPAALLGLAALVALVVGIFYQGMVVQLVRDVQDGRRDSSMGELFSSVGPVALPLFAVAILFGIGVAIGFVLLIVPGLILLTIWALVAPVTVVERPGIFAAFGRSRDLVRGNGWQVFGVIVLVFLLSIAVSIVALIVGAPFGDVGRGIVQWLASALVAPLSALVASVLYFALAGADDRAQEPAFADEPHPAV